MGGLYYRSSPMWGRSPDDPWIRHRKRSRPRQGVAPAAAYSSSATPWRGRISFPRSSFPGSSALRASTPGLRSDDPSGASPLRDRQVGLHSDRDCRFFEVELKRISPAPVRGRKAEVVLFCYLCFVFEIIYQRDFVTPTGSRSYLSLWTG